MGRLLIAELHAVSRAMQIVKPLGVGLAAQRAVASTIDRRASGLGGSVLTGYALHARAQLAGVAP